MARILVVEDNHDFATILYQLLSRLGHEVEIANDYETAVIQMHCCIFDLLLADQFLPGGTGTELAEKLDKCGKGKSIIISGADPFNIPDAPYIALLRKPMLFEDLKSTVDNALNTP